MGPGRAAASILLGCAAAWSFPPTARAQDPRPDTLPPERPGLYRAGPFYLTPRLRIGTIGLDTNVFYTATERQTDFTASGGPGLEVVLPIRSSVLLSVDGGVDYVYFLRTESQRRFAGDGKARLDLVGTRSAAGVEGGYRRSYSRPNFEVDRRIVQDQQHVRADGHVEVGERLDLRAEGTGTRLDVPPDQDFGGSDLRRTLSRDIYLGRLTMAYRIAPKTSFLLEGDHQADRFLLEGRRDSDSNRAGGGFEVVSATRLSGRAVGGVRSFRLRRATPAGEGDLLVPYVDVGLSYHFGPRTRFDVGYRRDVEYSAFETVTGLPVLHTEMYRVRLQKGLVGALDLRVSAGLTRLRSDGLIRVAVEGGEPTLAVRDDDAWEAGADLGYTFRRHLRIGAAVTYVERRSTIDDFGIDGLLVGGVITFTP
jgi:hypothetical protein